MTNSKVQLLHHSPTPDRTVAEIANVCYGGGKSMADKDIASLIKKLLDNKHMSPFEHVSFTFKVENISRVASHQLVRHRMASYMQTSHRYTKAGETDYHLPELPEDLYKAVVIPHMEISMLLYKLLLDAGVAKEDARYVLPQAVTSDIIITMNARSLLNFFELRTSRHAQKEIREIAECMQKLCAEAAPLIFNAKGELEHNKDNLN